MFLPTPGEPLILEKLEYVFNSPFWSNKIIDVEDHVIYSNPPDTSCWEYPPNTKAHFVIE